MRKFIEFRTRSKEGDLTTVTLGVDCIVAVERTLTSGAVLINGAAFSCSSSEAVRVAGELMQLKLQETT